MVFPVAYLGLWEASAMNLRNSDGRLIRENGSFIEQGRLLLLFDLAQLICLGAVGALCFWLVCRINRDVA